MSGPSTAYVTVNVADVARILLGNNEQINAKTIIIENTRDGILVRITILLFGDRWVDYTVHPPNNKAIYETVV